MLHWVRCFKSQRQRGELLPGKVHKPANLTTTPLPPPPSSGEVRSTFTHLHTYTMKRERLGSLSAITRCVRRRRRRRQRTQLSNGQFSHPLACACVNVHKRTQSCGFSSQAQRMRYFSFYYLQTGACAHAYDVYRVNGHLNHNVCLRVYIV